MPLTHYSLFTGIGGIDLAAEAAGFETVAQCEFADYPTKVLEKNFPGVPRFRDIRDVTKEAFYAKTNLRRVDLVSGGFPCQPFSIAGKRRGEEDDRFLWPEMLRVIKELRPSCVLGENVAGFIGLGLDNALSDLESEGYEARAFVLPACAVQAPHERARVFIIAFSDTVSFGWNQDKIQHKEPTKCFSAQKFKGVCFGGGEFDRVHRRELWDKADAGNNGDFDGVTHRVDRLIALGNAVVPQQVYPILKILAEILKQTKKGE